jgi:hypothetical protein
MQIQPFKIAVDPEDLLDLQRRLKQSRWAPSIAGAGWALGMDAEYLENLAQYWLQRFDWRSVEAALNRVPHFQAVTDSGTIHFVHLKGSAPKALPIVLTHGWPSTFAELLQVGDMLAYPAAYGAAPTDVFDVVIPSLPGFTFSSAPVSNGAGTATQ